LCIETSKELRTRLAEVVYVEYADQSLTKQLVTCSMDTAYPPIRNKPNYLKLIELEEETIIRYIFDRDSRGFSPRLANIEDIANYFLEAHKTKYIRKY
jgi:hypothetical protein